MCVRQRFSFLFFSVHECVLVVSVHFSNELAIYCICYGNGTGHNQTTNMQKKNTHRLGKQKDAANSASKDSVFLFSV